MYVVNHVQLVLEEFSYMWNYIWDAICRTICQILSILFEISNLYVVTHVELVLEECSYMWNYMSHAICHTICQIVFIKTSTFISFNELLCRIHSRSMVLYIVLYMNEYMYPFSFNIKLTNHTCMTEVSLMLSQYPQERMQLNIMFFSFSRITSTSSPSSWWR